MLGESHDAEQWKVTCPDLPANLVFEADEITAAFVQGKKSARGSKVVAGSSVRSTG